ncbi:hypothetical protein C8F01DRAFT_1174981, partial [Mycena amicta]
MDHSFTLGRPNSRPGFSEWYSTALNKAEVCHVLRRLFSTAMVRLSSQLFISKPKYLSTRCPSAGNLPDACAETHGRSRYQLRTFFSFAHCRIPSHIYSAQQSPVDTALPPRPHPSPTSRLSKIYERVIGGRLFRRLPPFVLSSCAGLSATKRDAQMALTDPPTLCLDTGWPNRTMPL